jgi:carbon monoxide dehydrogenase subunit G
VELTNEFSVRVPVDQAWSVLTDLERIAPCLPGAQLQEVEGDEYRGIVKVKVGPITAQYKGTATFLEQDEANHKAVIRAEGRDTRGQGNANATVTATLVPEGDGTHVTVVTDLTITGKVAQFGRGVMADVSSKLMGQFVEALEADVLSGSTPEEAAPPSAAAAPAAPAAEDSGPRKIDSKPAAPVDLLGTAGSPVVKRVGPVVGVLVVVLWLLRRRKKKK